jgi:hypothetical protein
MHIALVLTAKCTAKCGHCSASCGPQRTEHLAPTHLRRIMEEASRIDDGEGLHFDITGGEPFMDFEQLCDTLAYAQQLGGATSCVTNAFWARTDAIALQKLRTLRDLGLQLLAVSVSRFHEEFVPLASVGRALRAASQLGIETELKGAVTRADLTADGLVSRWRETLEADQVSIFPIIPHLRAGFPALPEAQYYREPGLPTGKCPSEIVTVQEDGIALSCCGQSPETSFLRIGDTHSEPLAAIQARFQHARRQRILRHCGPITFARRAIDAGHGHLLRDAYAGPCDLCLHIGSTPELRQIADEMSAPGEPVRKAITTNKRRLSVPNEIDNILLNLLAKAAANAVFCQRLLESPEDAAAEFFSTLDEQDLATLRLVEEDLKRIGADSKLHPADARHWALGLLISLERWAVDGEGIKKNPAKKKAPAKAPGKGIKKNPAKPALKGIKKNPVLPLSKGIKKNPGP